MLGFRGDRTFFRAASGTWRSAWNELGGAHGRRPLKPQKFITAAIHGIKKHQAISDIKTLDHIKDETAFAGRIEAALLGVFATVALLLAAIGIYGLSCTRFHSERTRWEFAPRSARRAPAYSNSSQRPTLRNGTRRIATWMAALQLIGVDQDGRTMAAPGRAGSTNRKSACIYLLSSRCYTSILSLIPSFGA
jgi:hypothetical protein